MSTYEAWRATHQDAEAAAKEAFEQVQGLAKLVDGLQAALGRQVRFGSEAGNPASGAQDKMPPTQQPEALRLAELIRLSGALPGSVSDDAASELRRLHAENQELKEQMAAIGAGGVEPLRKTSALRAALEEAEAALEVATSRLSARGANYPVHVTSEARALEIVRKALGKSQADHFRDATKMMPADGASMVPEGRKLAAQQGVRQSIERDVRAIVDLLKNREWAEHTGQTELGRELEHEITKLYNATHPAPQGLDAQTIKHISALSELVRMPNAEYFADAHNAAVRHLRTIAAQAEQGE